MPAFNFFIIYVADAAKSTKVYNKILGMEPAMSSPGFVQYGLPNGAMFGLWNKDEVDPKATAPGGVEFCLPVDNETGLNKTLAEYQALGLTIAQKPTKMDFGLTFTALDPDGHRIRVFVPAM